MDVIRITDTMI